MEGVIDCRPLTPHRHDQLACAHALMCNDMSPCTHLTWHASRAVAHQKTWPQEGWGPSDDGASCGAGCQCSSTGPPGCGGQGVRGLWVSGSVGQEQESGGRGQGAGPVTGRVGRAGGWAGAEAALHPGRQGGAGRQLGWGGGCPTPRQAGWGGQAEGPGRRLPYTPAGRVGRAGRWAGAEAALHPGRQGGAGRQMGRGGGCPTPRQAGGGVLGNRTYRSATQKWIQPRNTA